jgi:xanthine dehydrogenase molybdopterin-binding subunit B
MAALRPGAVTITPRQDAREIVTGRARYIDDIKLPGMLYGKILRKKSTILSMEIAPYFYSLSENYGSPEEGQ